MAFLSYIEDTSLKWFQMFDLVLPFLTHFTFWLIPGMVLSHPNGNSFILDDSDTELKKEDQL